MDFWKIYGALKRRIWVVIAAAVLTTSAAAVGSTFLGTYYRAAATLMPSERALERTPYMGGAASTDSSGQHRSQINNLVALARSRYVAGQVIRKLHLRTTPDRLLQEVSVGPASQSGNTDLLRLEVTNKNPNDAVRITNAMAQTFVEFYDDLSHRDAARTRKFLEDQAEAARLKLRTKQMAVAQYQRRTGVVSVPDELAAAVSATNAKMQERDQAAAQVAQLTEELRTVDEQIAATPKERTVTEMSSNNPVFQQLQADVTRLETQLMQERAIHTDEHPNVKRLQNQLDQARARMEQERGKLVATTRVVDNPRYQDLISRRESLEAARQGAMAKLNSLQRDLAQRQSKLAHYNGVDLALAALMRDFNLAQDNYAAALQRLDQARADEKVSTNTGAINIVDLADVADGPIQKGPSRAQLIALALVLGLALGAGSVIGLEAIDTTVRSRQDLEGLMELPVTGLIPRLAAASEQRLALPKITHLQPGSPHAEAYRFLATDLLLSTATEPAKTVMVATAKPGQGGTSTISNLAITMAQAGRRVVLVDADMRRPSLHTVFGLRNDVGLSTLLSNGHALEDALQPTGIRELAVLTAGPVPENPWQLLRSARMRDLVEELKSSCDFVFFDTPSAVVFADAMAVASLVDGAIFVVRAQEAPAGSEIQIKGLLNKANLRILAVVLNDVPAMNVDSYRFYSHYYRAEAREALASAQSPALPAGTLEEEQDL